MHPSPKKVPKKRKKKNWGRKKRSRPPRKIMVSVENGDEVESEVEDAPEGIVGCESVQNSCQPKQSVVGSESSVHRKEPGQGLPWESLLGPPTTPRVLPKPSIAASEFFAEHFGQYKEALLLFFHLGLETCVARCGVDWDYPNALFSIGGYEPEPVSQKRVSPQTRAAFARPGRGNVKSISRPIPITNSPFTIISSTKHDAACLGTGEVYACSW
jgi:hypothetical protein